MTSANKLITENMKRWMADTPALSSQTALARAATVCTMLAGVANQRGAAFNGRINGQPYKTNVNWNADHNDPRFLDPIECTQRLAKLRELQAQQAATQQQDATVESQPPP